LTKVEKHCLKRTVNLSGILLFLKNTDFHGFGSKSYRLNGKAALKCIISSKKLDVKSLNKIILNLLKMSQNTGGGSRKRKKSL